LISAGVFFNGAQHRVLADLQNTCGISYAAAGGNHIKDLFFSRLQTAFMLERALEKLPAAFAGPPLSAVGAVTVFAQIAATAKGT
jgi:hypothetical protein